MFIKSVAKVVKFLHNICRGEFSLSHFSDVRWRILDEMAKFLDNETTLFFLNFLSQSFLSLFILDSDFLPPSRHSSIWELQSPSGNLSQPCPLSPGSLSMTQSCRRKYSRINVWVNILKPLEAVKTNWNHHLSPPVSLSEFGLKLQFQFGSLTVLLQNQL